MRVGKWARRLEGVDTSQPMLAQAGQKNVYHRLHQQDLVAFLESNESSFDAVTCAATLIHFGDLRPAFEAIAARLRSGGIFVCTLFPNDDDESGIAVGSFDGLAEGGCYVHGRAYVAALAEATGFAVESIDRELHEYFRGKPRMGLIVTLRRNMRAADSGCA
jgi:predicted TPR repeat methyltransferase